MALEVRAVPAVAESPPMRIWQYAYITTRLDGSVYTHSIWLSQTHRDGRCLRQVKFKGGGRPTKWHGFWDIEQDTDHHEMTICFNAMREMPDFIPPPHHTVLVNSGNGNWVGGDYAGRVVNLKFRQTMAKRADDLAWTVDMLRTV